MDAEPRTPSLSEIVRSFPFRVGLYAVLTLVLFETVYAAIQSYGAEFMARENGPLEIAQAVLALIAAAGLFCASRWTPIGRAALICCGAVVTYAAAREADELFETLMFDDAYKWVVGLPMAILFVSAVIASRRHFLADTMWLMRHPAATLFAIGGIYLCFVCQVLDRPQMWSGLEGQMEAAATKAMIEEYSELFAYLLLAFSGVEAALFAHRGRAIEQSGEVHLEPTEAYRIAA